jgi:hypothetical protein
MADNGSNDGSTILIGSTGMLMRIRIRCLELRATVVFAALLPCVAFATLGEPVASVQADGQELRGSIKEADHGNYRLHEIQLPSGTLVREYSGLDGNVFAVTWSGPFPPNLRQTLGRYFEPFVTAAKAAHGDHRHLRVEQGDVVVEARGHMRAFAGRAYLPAAIPSGVSIGDLQ